MRYASHRPRSITVTLLAERRSKLALAVIPTDLRASVEGDLSEHLETRVVPELGLDGARRWLYAEIVRSTPAMVRHRLLGGPAEARRRRWLCGAPLFVLQSSLFVPEFCRQDIPSLLLALLAAWIFAPFVSLLLDAKATTVVATGNVGNCLVLVTFALNRNAFDTTFVWYLLFPGLYAIGARDGLWFERRNRSKRAVG